MDLFAGQEDLGAQIVAGAAPGYGALEWCRRDEEVLVDAETELWREHVEEGACGVGHDYVRVVWETRNGEGARCCWW